MQAAWEIGNIERLGQRQRIDGETLKPAGAKPLGERPPTIRVSEAAVDTDVATTANRVGVEWPPIIFRMSLQPRCRLLTADRTPDRCRDRAICLGGSDDRERSISVSRTETIIITVGAHAFASPRMR